MFILYKKKLHSHSGTKGGTALYKRLKQAVYLVATDQGVGGSNPLTHGEEKTLTNGVFKPFVRVFVLSKINGCSRTYGIIWSILGY